MTCATCKDTGIVDAGHPSYSLDDPCPHCQGPQAIIDKLQSQLKVAKEALEAMPCQWDTQPGGWDNVYAHDCAKCRALEKLK